MCSSSLFLYVSVDTNTFFLSRSVLTTPVLWLMMCCDVKCRYCSSNMNLLVCVCWFSLICILPEIYVYNNISIWEGGLRCYLNECFRSWHNFSTKWAAYRSLMLRAYARPQKDFKIETSVFLNFCSTQIHCLRVSVGCEQSRVSTVLSISDFSLIFS